MFLGYIDPGTGFTVVGIGAWFIAFLCGFLGVFSLFFKRIVNFFKKHIHIVITVLVLIPIAIGVIIMRNEQSPFNQKVVILGMDGLSPEILEPMMQAGELPYFSQLKERGSYARLATTNPSQSPVAWAGCLTGKNPGKHGVFDFICREPEDYMLKLAMTDIQHEHATSVIKSTPFWEYTSERKIPATVIAAPLTFPPTKLYGKMLSGMGVPDMLGTQGTFSFYTTEPIAKEKDIGGNVFSVEKSNIMQMELLGPRQVTRSGSDNVTIPFMATRTDERDSLLIHMQKQTFSLQKGEWSSWHEVTFSIGLFKKIKGIVKFYLVETEPALKLYVSPINFDPRDPFFRISYPKSYSKELAQHIGLFYTQGMPCHTWAVNEKRLTEEPFVIETSAVLEEKKAMLDYELARLKQGILFCYFETSDVIQHMFWRYRDAQHPLYEDSATSQFADIIKTWYKKMDTILGDTLQHINDGDTVIVVSDHGFNTFRRAAHVNTWLRENGYLQLNDPQATEGADLLEDIDWAHTRAYAIGFGGIYINQRGREGQGIVNPGQETEQLKKEIAAKMRAWTDEKFGAAVVNDVYTREDIFWGPYAQQAPDLYIGFHIGYRASWQTALGGAPETMIEDNIKQWSGDHLFDPKLVPGILLTNFAIHKDNPSLYDITPTILKKVGFDEDTLSECDFDGETLY